MSNRINGYCQHDEDYDNEQFLRNFEYKGEEELFACYNCETEISEEEYQRNEGLCDECNTDNY